MKITCYNFFFHPLHESHNRCRKTEAVITAIALSILSAGIYLLAFVVVRLCEKRKVEEIPPLVTAIIIGDPRPYIGRVPPPSPHPAPSSTAFPPFVTTTTAYVPILGPGSPSNCASSSSAHSLSSVMRRDDSETAELRQALLHNPISVLGELNGLKLRTLKGHPEIFECHCCDQFSRKNEGDMRQATEDRLIEQIQVIHPVGSEITVCSMASCGCFQELVLHAKLVEAGYRVRWIIADPFYKRPHPQLPSLSEVPKVFTQLVNQLSPGTEVLAGHDFEEIFAELKQTYRDRPIPQVDVFMAIDADLDHVHISLDLRETPDDEEGDCPDERVNAQRALTHLIDSYGKEHQTIAAFAYKERSQGFRVRGQIATYNGNNETFIRDF